jgi:hypothetical protein
MRRLQRREFRRSENKSGLGGLASKESPIRSQNQIDCLSKINRRFLVTGYDQQLTTAASTNMPNDFEQLKTLIACFTELGAKRIYCKALAENDNSKQQIYLGGSFEVLKQLVFGEISSHPALKQPNYKAPVPLFWINSKGQSEQAAGSQLILYPKYPEIRLSGFLKGCTIAPSSLFQPIPKSKRKFNNAGDGRFLFLGVSESKVFAYAVEAGSQLALETNATLDKQPPTQEGILRELISNARNRRSLLLGKLIAIHAAGWHPSMRLDRSGNTIAYSASNGGGYTLEDYSASSRMEDRHPILMGGRLKLIAAVALPL